MSKESSGNMKELYSIFHKEYIIMAEYRMLQTENLEGIYVIPSYENSFRKQSVYVTTSCMMTVYSIQIFLTVWYGVIFVRSGIYAGGVFRFSLSLPENFPDDKVPTVTFTSQLYHPAVDGNTGELNLNKVFSQWDKKQNHIWQILKYLLWIFNNINIKAPANNEASLMFKTNKKGFIEKVKECIIQSHEHLYDAPITDDKHYITFKPYDPKIHDAAKNKMLKPKENDENNHGISWVQTGSYQSFSKEASQ